MDEESQVDHQENSKILGEFTDNQNYFAFTQTLKAERHESRQKCSKEMVTCPIKLFFKSNPLEKSVEKNKNKNKLGEVPKVQYQG